MTNPATGDREPTPEFVLVPCEPTPDMLTTVGTIAGWNEAASRHADECHIEWWKAMLAATPRPSSDTIVGELDGAGLAVAYAYVVDGECEEIGWGAPPIDDPSTVLLYASPALSALPVDHPEVVGVKALRWEYGEGNYEGQQVWHAGDPWLFWIVKNADRDEFVWCETLNIDGFVPASPVRGSFATLDLAQAAAQQDYESRILSALDFTNAR